MTHAKKDLKKKGNNLKRKDAGSGFRHNKMLWNMQNVQNIEEKLSRFWIIQCWQPSGTRNIVNRDSKDPNSFIKCVHLIIIEMTSLR